ncbi:hypothetical protein Gpo141_00008866 [Globisporangium polare]
MMPPSSDNDEDNGQQQQHSRSTRRKIPLRSKHEVAATLLKMDHFADRLALIRSEIANRNSNYPGEQYPLPQQQQALPLPPAQAATAHAQAESRLKAGSFENLKLPLVRLLAANSESAARPRDPFLSIDAVQQRAALQQQFTTDTERLASAEQLAADALQKADRLSEESRIAMVIYTQNERSWSFDERASRYQKVLEAKRLAEVARSNADDQKAVVQRLRSELVNPYGPLRESPRPLTKRQHHIAPRTDTAATPKPSHREASTQEDFMYVWMLAAPSTNLSFTPRDSTTSAVLVAEKELSTHVVYYAAASSLNDEDEANLTLAEDSPPSAGWISCSSHGVAPVPEVKSVKSSIETWVVSGAGVGHLNGKYIFNGVHDSVRKFKSSTGVELFRKRVPVASSFAQGLHDAPVEKKSRQLNRDIGTPDLSSDNANATAANQGEEATVEPNSATPLPSALKAIERDESDFNGMSRIGSWLGANEVKEKYRRRLENELLISTSRDHSGVERVAEDGDHVLAQDAKGRFESATDIQESRPEASAELCREWVLFMVCSRRHVVPSNGVSVPPQQKSGLGCLKRHYYISVQEKETMAIWAQEKEARLEQNVLQHIIRREEQIARVQRLCTKCMSKFQQNLTRETEKLAHQILTELNTVRFLSVKVLEAIEKWRAHARKIGFARLDVHNNTRHEHKGTQHESSKQSQGQDEAEQEPPLLGWSASITVSTGKQLFKGSNAFVSKVKRFCRAEDAVGKKEQQIVYLGYFATRMEAERAYEEYATAEARRLNTTAAHLPRHRNVFRSCGKHFAVESERLGPSVCIECKVKQLASLSSGEGGAAGDEWAPPFYYTPGENYILKMGNDLDFLDSVPPITILLNDGHGSDDLVFPILGNVFLLPKTPIQDPALAMFTSCRLARAPRLGISLETERDVQEITEETLDRERILIVQKIFLQELQIYRPELFPESVMLSSNTVLSRCKTSEDDQDSRQASEYRLVEALYWDRCAALRIQQKRAPLAFRQENIWCRPDAGEWASLAVRGKHQLHFLFELKLALAGKEVQEKRRQILKALRRLLKTPLYWVPTREHFAKLIDEGCAIKGDVVMLEVKSATKYLDKYDVWCRKTLVIQRWYRGVRGRHRARVRRKALRLACTFRKRFAAQVVSVATSFYQDLVVPQAIKRAVRRIQTPEFSTALKLNGEFVIVSFHSLHFAHHHNSFSSPRVQSKTTLAHRLRHSVCCAGCARRFHVRAEYKVASGRFEVSSGGVCSCSLNGGTSESNSNRNPESWLVRAYNPTSNTTYRMRMENALVRQLLLSPSLPKFGRLPSSPASPVTSLVQGNPMALKWSMHERATIASIQANFYHTQGEKAYQELLNWRLLSSEATQRRKTAVVHRDRTVNRLESLKRSYLVSIDSAKAALDFTSRRFHEAQAWDPLENASDWKLLVQKRQLQKDLIATENELDKCRWEVFQSTYNEQFLRVRAAQVQDQYENEWLPLIHQKNLQMESASTLETQSKTFVEHSMRQICTQFLTLRDGCFLPTRRHLVLQSRTWKERSGVRIAIPGLLRSRNVMRRRVLLLSNSGKATSNKRNERMIVEISVSPSASAGTRSSDDVWVAAYNPVTSFVQEVFLEWELVELLVELKKKKKKDQYPLTDGDQRRSALLNIAEQLLSMAMLDRFTGEFTLRKLQFYHHMRLLSPQFLSSKWFLDLKRGRKCGDGDEILRQAVCVDGKLVVAVVFENWGDLTFALYHATSGETYRLTVTLSETFRLLSAKPLMLRLWICCVKANNYNPAMLMYLLKHVRFQQYDESSVSMLVVDFEPTIPSKTVSKRFQKAMRIHDRRVLLSIKEDAGGDFAIDAFDWPQNHNYRLVVEREQIRRLLRRSAVPSTPSFRYLMLQKNRLELYEWIVGRLTFQSLLEHPQLLATAHSPLMFGAHLRESFVMFNQWVASSVRNPLQCIGEQELDRWAATVDTAAFSQLQFDQLALIADEAIPFGYDKDALGTLDWFVPQSSSASSETRGKDSPFMKMDFFVKNHNLFVRLRKELEAETAIRLERTSRGALETQEKLSLWAEIQNALESTSQLFSNWQQCADTAKRIIEERAIVMGQLHRELIIKIKADDVSRVQLRDAEKRANDLLFNDEDDESATTMDFHELFGESLVGGDADVASKVVGFSSGALNVAARFLSMCWDHIENTLKPVLAKLDARILQTTAQQQQSSRLLVPLETLKEMWRELLRFQSSTVVQAFTRDGVASENSVRQSLGWTSAPASAAGALSAQGDAQEDRSCEPTTPQFETGILIPSKCEEPMQELFLGGTSVSLDNLAGLLKSLVGLAGNTRTKARDDITIRVKPVHNGILAYQTSSSNAEDIRGAKRDWNPRASAIAVDNSTRIVGAALYYPTHKIDSSFLERLDRITTLSRDTTLSSEPSLSSNYSQQVARRKQMGNRVKQQLPWKIYAGERLQVARSLKRMRAAEQLALNAIDITIKAVESRTLATLPVEFRRLELLFGECFSVNHLKALLSTEVENLLVAHKPSSCGRKTARDWTLSVVKPLSMRNALVAPLLVGGANPTVDGALSKSSGLKLEHLQVEVDSLEQPRRLIFSCRELQSQRKYYLDCSSHQLQALLSRDPIDCVTTTASVPSFAPVLGIADWRRFALQAAQLLVFRKKNGAVGLDFRSCPLAGEATTVGVTAGDDASVSIGAQAVPVAISTLSKENQSNLKSVLRSCLLRRFEKHQVAIRARACEGLLTSYREQLPVQHIGGEWMRMMKEDFAAHECRGLLVLDQKQLKKLQTAVTAVTKRVRALISKNFSADPNISTNRLMSLQLQEFVKEMGLSEQVNAGALENAILAMRETAQRIKRKRPPIAHEAFEGPPPPVELKEIAEWWRRHLLKPKEA